MTNPTSASRFVVRRDGGQDTWMVWDRQLRGPAKLHLRFAIRLSEADALQLKDKLEQQQRKAPCSRAAQ
jgi:hypothetical protein